MTYEHSTPSEVSEDPKNRQSAGVMAAFFLVVMIIWLGGAGVMLMAAWKGTTIQNTAPSDSSVSEPAVPPEADVQSSAE